MKQLNPKLRKGLIFIGILIICTAITALLFSMEPEEKKTIEKKKILKTVIVEEAEPGTHKSIIKVYGEVIPKWETTLKSEVEGKVTYLSESMLNGSRLKAGEKLIAVEQDSYAVAVKEAKLRLENAKLSYLQEERKASRAKADWKRSGVKGSPSSALVFREPQLKVAKAEIEAAESQLSKAKNDFEKTVIKAPFDSTIAKRSVSKGDVLFSGSEIAKLVSSDDVEIKIKLDSKQTSSIGQWKDKKVVITDTLSNHEWSGYIARSDGFLDDKTRLKGFYIKTFRAEGELLPGTFATVSIESTHVKNALSLHESSLTRDGYVWYTDENNRLKRIRAEVLFYHNQRVYVKCPEELDYVRVVVTPVQSFIEGTEVKPIMEASK